MKLIKKPFGTVPIEPVHGIEKGRRLYIKEDEMKNFAAMTYGYLPSGGKYGWHVHKDINEVALMIKGKGTLKDEDGEYEYNEGDFFIIPANVEHEFENTSDSDNEFVFVRIKE